MNTEEEINKIEILRGRKYSTRDNDKQDWISVSDRLPEVKKLVIVDGGVAYYNGAFWLTVTCFPYPGQRITWKVTHWMPLPELPKYTND